MKSKIFKQFAESAVAAGTELVAALEKDQQDAVNTALGLGASVAVSLSFDANGHSTVRLEVVSAEGRSCLAALSGHMPTVQ